jgi:hypothetical protein
LVYGGNLVLTSKTSVKSIVSENSNLMTLNSEITFKKTTFTDFFFQDSFFERNIFEDWKNVLLLSRLRMDEGFPSQLKF